MMRQRATKAHIDALKPAMWGNAKKSIVQEVSTGQLGIYRSSDRNMLFAIRFEGTVMVIVLAVGKGLAETRPELFELARLNGCTTIRFHTKAPQHLAKAMHGLNIQLQHIKKRLFGADEYVFTYEVSP